MDGGAREDLAWADRRRITRMPVANEGLRIEIAGGQGEISIEDLSVDGFRGVCLDARGQLGLDGRHRLWLQPDMWVACGVRPVEWSRRGGLHARLALSTPADRARLAEYLTARFVEQALRWSEQFPGWREELGASSRDWVRQTLIHFTVRLGRPIKLFLGGQVMPALLRVLDLSTDAGRQILVCELQGESLGSLTACADLSFGFAGAHSIHMFQSQIWRQEGRRICLLMPGRLLQTAFRRSRRCRASEQELDVWIQHPRMPGLWLRRRLRDVSGRGLAFVFVPGRDLLSMGERLPRLRLPLAGRVIEAEGLVRSFSRDGDELRCGVELLGFRDAGQAEAWSRFVLRLSHPRLRVGTRRSVRQAWRALEASRFIEEISPQLRPAARKRFLAGWRKFADDSSLSRYLLLYERGRIAGIVSASLLYPGTWLPHHFGLDAGLRATGKQVLFSLARENLSGLMELLLAIDGLEHVMIFADADKAWNELIFRKFERRFGDPGRVQVDETEVWKVQLDGAEVEDGASAGIGVCGANSALRALLQRRLSQMSSPLELRAQALLPEQFDLEDFCRHCAAKGYERSRVVRFALLRGRPVAALVMETGPDGLNLFGLLDRCRLVSLRAGVEQDVRVVRALMREACRYYIRRGKSEFILLQEPGCLARDAWPGMHLVAGGLRFIAHRTVLPAWKGYIEDLMLMLESSPATVLW